MNEIAPDRSGEAFDEQRRNALPAAALRGFYRQNDALAWWGVADTLGIAGLAIAAALIWWSPWVVVPAILIVATRQHAIMVLSHEATHYRMFRRRWLNELVGTAIGWLVGVSMHGYRVVHRLHHNHLYEPIDPDLPLNAGYPRGTAYLLKKLTRDLAGLTAHKNYAYFFGAPAGKRQDGQKLDPLADTSPALRRAALRDRWFVVGVHIAVPLLALWAGLLIEYLLLWLLPLVTINQMILRLRAVLEHGAVADLSTPLRAARTNLVPSWFGWLLFPHHVNYHIEHHLYPAVPHYRLPALHRALARAGVLRDAEVRPVWQTFGLIFAERPAGALKPA